MQVLQRMGNHQCRDDFLMSIFIDGLYPMELRAYMKEGAIATYAQAYARAKTWEECRLENEFVMYTNNTYSNNLIPSHSGTLPIIENNYYYVTDAPYVQNLNVPSYIHHAIDKTPQQEPANAKYDNAIWNLTK